MWILHFNRRFALPITSILPHFWTLPALLITPPKSHLVAPFCSPSLHQLTFTNLSWSCLCPLLFLPASKSIFCPAIFIAKCIGSYRKSMLLLPSSDLRLLMSFGRTRTLYIWKAPAALEKFSTNKTIKTRDPSSVWRKHSSLCEPALHQEQLLPSSPKRKSLSLCVKCASSCTLNKFGLWSFI